MENLRDSAEFHRFEAEVDGHVGVLKYLLRDGLLTLVHTEVPEEIRGRRVAEALARFARRLGPGSNVVTLMADSGLKYLSTDVYRSR